LGGQVKITGNYQGPFNLAGNSCDRWSVNALQGKGNGFMCAVDVGKETLNKTFKGLIAPRNSENCYHLQGA